MPGETSSVIRKPAERVGLPSLKTLMEPEAWRGACTPPVG